jgi:hypothetical protein
LIRVETSYACWRAEDGRKDPKKEKRRSNHKEHKEHIAEKTRSLLCDLCVKFFGS